MNKKYNKQAIGKEMTCRVLNTKYNVKCTFKQRIYFQKHVFELNM